MTITTRAITTSPVTKKISLSGMTETTTTYRVIGLSKNAAKVFAALTTGFYTSVDDGASFQLAHTFTGEQVVGAVELANGELAVSTSVSAAGSAIWVSSGWASNPATATWSKSLDNSAHTTAVFSAEFSCNPCSVGSNGIFVTNEYGAQTASGAPASNSNAATRVYLSTDNAKTFTQIFNLYTDGNMATPAGVHCHSTVYDELNDRIWLSFGDGVGDSWNVAGANKAQLAYSDSHGATGSWVFVPDTVFASAAEWVNCFSTPNPGSGMQWTTLHISPYGLHLATDSAPYCSWTIPRTGYRTFGPPQVGITRGKCIGEMVWQNPGSTLAVPTPMFFGWLGGDSGQGDRTRLAASHDNGMTMYDVYLGAIDLNNTSISAFGPTANGKLVGNTGVGAGLKLLRGTVTVAP